MDRELVDYTEPLHVDGQGRLILDGAELHPCCLEAVDFGHGDCDTGQFIAVPVARKSNRREPIPVKENWRVR